jgi:hypothetical protein
MYKVLTSEWKYNELIQISEIMESVNNLVITRNSVSGTRVIWSH